MGSRDFAQDVFDGLVIALLEDGHAPREALESAALRYGLDNRRLLLVRNHACPPPRKISERRMKELLMWAFDDVPFVPDKRFAMGGPPPG